MGKSKTKKNLHFLHSKKSNIFTQSIIYVYYILIDMILFNSYVACITNGPMKTKMGSQPLNKYKKKVIQQSAVAND